MIGCEYVIDASGCDARKLASKKALDRVVRSAVADLALTPVGEIQWHVFGGPGGITGLLMLSESHLTLHTFPERGYAAFNLYHCSAQPEWPWQERLRDLLGASDVQVRRLVRREATAALPRVPDLRL